MGLRARGHSASNIDKDFQDWFYKKPNKSLMKYVKVPRYVARQQHRANPPAHNPLQYFKLNAGISFLDHIDQEMRLRFCEENRPGRDLSSLVPSIVRKWSNPHSMNEKLQVWKDDIPIHLSLLNEIKKLKRHWSLQQPQEHPTTLFECYLATVRTFPPISRHC